MSYPLFHVDAFTSRPFSGNPAAVCLLPSWKDDRWLQAVAAEMNLSETAFLVKNASGFDLRWFTPKVEVDLCGHATLASAHVLWGQGKAKPADELQFTTKSGVLKAIHAADNIELDFPLKPEESADPPPGLLQALGGSAKYVGRSQFDFIVEMESEAAVRSLAPDFTKLASVSARGIIVTSRSADPKFDFVSRFFAPAAGIDEDPVTGSAHCCLGDFWQKRLKKSQFVAYQASAQGGIVKVRVTNDRAFLGGSAFLVSSGVLLVE